MGEAERLETGEWRLTSSGLIFNLQPLIEVRPETGKKGSTDKEDLQDKGTGRREREKSAAQATHGPPTPQAIGSWERHVNN